MHGPTWLQISFDSPVTITKINAMVNQGCPGYRTDPISVTFANGLEVPVGLWRGLRKQDCLLPIQFPWQIADVKSLRIKTFYIRESWVAWSFVEVFGY